MAFMALVAGCVPSPSSESLSSSVVLTKRAPNVNFSNYKTFFLRPEIRQLSDTSQSTVLPDNYATPLLAQTRKQLIDRGYDEVETQANAELAIEMLYITSTWVATSCYSWWDPYYWGYPYWGYYPYYGGCSASTWQSNTLATLMVDLTPAKSPTTSRTLAANTEPDDGGSEDSGAAEDSGVVDSGGGIVPKLLGGIWFSGVYGIQFSSSDSLQKGLDGIDQAFTQSPYLTSY
jgi:hypothetical protein